MMNKMINGVNLPAYVRTAQDILEAIEKNIYEENTMLPSERQLAAKYQVSTIVINKAMNLLSEQNVIEKIPRKGNIVRKSQRVTTVAATTVKIAIHGVHSPKFINESQQGFKDILNSHFPKLGIHYTQETYVSKGGQNFPENSDIIICSERLLAKFALEGRLAPLPEITTQPDIPNYYPQPFEACRVDNQLLAVPLNFNPTMLYCNKRILEKVNFDKDLGTIDWQAFIKLCHEIKQQLPTIFPMGYFDFVSCWWENFFYAHGLDIIKQDKFETDIFGDQGKQAINIMKTLIDNKLADNLTIRRNALDMLNQDQVAFFMCNPRTISELQDKEKWFFAPVPMASCRVAAANSFVVAINAKSKHVESCKDILQFIQSLDFQRWLGSEQAIVPIHRQALKDSYNTPRLMALHQATETAKMLPNRIEYWNTHDELSRSIHQLIHGLTDWHTVKQNINNKLYEERQEWNSIKLLGMA